MRYPGINLHDDIKHLISVLFALIPMLLLYFIISPVSAAIDLSSLSVSGRIILISAIVVAVTAVSSYFICRHNSGSAWYIPVLVTLGTMWMISGSLSDYWTRNAEIWLLVVALILATVLGILGSLKGEQIHKE